MTMTGDQYVALAKSLVAAAAQKNLVLRVIAGVAVRMTCPGIETHPTLQRDFKDLDFVSPRDQWEQVAAVFLANGISPRSQQTEGWIFEKDGGEIELTVPDFASDHRIDLTSRLLLSSPTLPLADLLLLKLQRVQFEEKDRQDSIALLLDHRVTRGEAEDQIDHQYIATLCSGQWGLFQTIYDNTVTLEKVLDKYLEPEEAQLVWRRIELVQGDMDRQPKSMGWMFNQLLRKPSQLPR